MTGVCSTTNLALVKSLGASQVIDYTREDFTRNSETYDLIFDTVGNRSLSDCRRALAAKGALVMVGGPNKGRWLGPLAGTLKAAVVSRFVSQKLIPFLAHLKKDDLIWIKGLLETGQITPVIDRIYPLSEVPAAIRYLEEGHARGKIVITMTEA